MADRKTSQEDEAGALTGDELLRIVQDGASRRTTIQAVVILAASSAGGGVPSTLSGAHTAIETETLGVVLSDGAGNTNFINMSLYGSNNAIIYAAALNVYLKAGGNVSVSAPGSVKLRGRSGVVLQATSGGISMAAAGDLALSAGTYGQITVGSNLGAVVGGGAELVVSGQVTLRGHHSDGVEIAALSGPAALSGTGVALQAGGTAGIQLAATAGAVNVSSANSLGVSIAQRFILHASQGIYLHAQSGGFVLNAFGGNVDVTAPAGHIFMEAKYDAELHGGKAVLRGTQGYGVSIFADEGPISLTPNNATQAVHLQNRVEADGWPTADPAVSNRLWIDGDIVRRSDGSGDPVIATKGALLQAVSTQSIGNTTWTSAQFTTGDGNPALDEDGFYDSGHNTRLTMPRDGWYVITSWHTWAGNNTGQRYARLLLNGTTSLTQDSRIVSASGNDPNVVMSIVHKFSAGDYVELQGWQSSGGSLNLAGAILRIAPLP